MSEEEKGYIDAVRGMLSDQVLAVQSAEEALELALACLKMYRILEGSNPTPVTLQQAHESILEEYSDLETCMTVSRYNVPAAVQARREIRKMKLPRWVSRLMGRGANNG